MNDNNVSILFLFLIKHFFKCVALLCIYIIIIVLLLIYMWDFNFFCMYLYPRSSIRGRGVYCFTSVCLSVQDIFRHIFLSNWWWQKSDIWSQASYRYTILWVAFLNPSDSYFLFADFVDFYTHLTYICICTFFVAFF